VFKIAKEEKMILDVTVKKVIARKTIANVIKAVSHVTQTVNANPAKTLIKHFPHNQTIRT
jgi:hypothetical protein